MRAARVVGLALWVAGGCASSGKSERPPEDGRPAATSTTQGTATSGEQVAERRQEAKAFLQDCARLTFASRDQGLTARLSLDVQGVPLALHVVGEDGQPAELMCPADRMGARQILGSGNGRSWGQEGGAVWWRAVAWCSRGLDGSAGACSLTEEEIPVRRPGEGASAPARAAAPAVAAAPAGVARSPESRRYSVRRLGTDVRSGALPANTPALLLRLDAALTLCLHARQPDLSTSTTTDLALQVYMNDQQLTGAPLEPAGGAPAALAQALVPCLQRALSATGNPLGALADVRYAVVAAPTRHPPGTYVQRVEVSLLQDQVETSVPTVERNRFAADLAKRLERCVALQPVEILVGPDRWYAAPPVRLVGSVDATRRDAVHVQALRAEASELLQEQAQCVLRDLPQDPQGTAAHAEWSYTVRVSGGGDPGEFSP